MKPGFGLLVLLLAASQAQTQQQCPPVAAATASIEGTVLKLGTNEPISGVDVELIRVEGTRCAPLATGAAAAYSRFLLQGGNGSRDVPAALAAEAAYVKTTDSGRFAFRNLKGGTYRLVGERGGGAYTPAAYGQRDPRGDGLAFPLAEGQAMKDANIAMAATGAIAGRVFDADSEPVSHAIVLALEPQYKDGRRVLNIAQAVETDERGEFRLFWLTPGPYYVAARQIDTRRRTQALWIVPPGRTGGNERADSPILTRQILPTGETVESISTLVYYGGTINPDNARPIDLAPGATFGGADIPVGAGRVRSWHIRGTFLGVMGEPLANRALRAVPVQPGPGNAILTTSTATDGSFDFAGAVSGRYAVFLASGGSGSLSTTASGNVLTGVPYGSRTMPYVEVTVGNADVNGVPLVQRPAATTSAAIRVSIEGRPVGVPDSDLGKIRINLVRNPDTLGMPITSLEGSGAQGSGTPTNIGATFRLVDPGPGNFRVVATGLPANGYVKSIRMGPTEILAGGLQLTSEPPSSLDVVIGVDAGTLTGIAMNDRREPLSNAVVALVPDARDLRTRMDLYRNTTTDESGRFQLSVAPGDYKVFAWQYVPHGAWMNADFIAAQESFGRPIRVTAGDKQDTQVSVIAVRP